MSENVRKVKLGDVVSLITKGTTPTSIGYDFTDSGINFIKIESISDEGEFIESKFAYISEKCNNKLKRSQLVANDILFSIAGAIGRVAKVTENILPANMNQALALIRIKPGIVDYDFLCYLLQSRVITEQFEKKKQGVAQLNISLADIGNFEIPLIEYDQQLNIVKKLDRVTDIINKRKHQLEKLDELIKSQFIEMFGDPITNAKLWPTDTVERVCERIYGGGTPSKSRPEFYDGQIPWVTPKDMKTTTIVDSVDHITEDAIKCSATNIVPKGAVLMVIRSGILKHTLPVALSGNIVTINQDMKAFVVRKEIINAAFLLHYFQAIEKDVLSEVRGVTADNIDFKAFVKRKVILPPIDLQNQFAAFVEQTDKSKFTIKQSLAQLEVLKKSLMQKYFG